MRKYIKKIITVTVMSGVMLTSACSRSDGENQENTSKETSRSTEETVASNETTTADEKETEKSMEKSSVQSVS